MYNYRKRFFYPIHVDRPDPAFAKLLLEHYGGKDGELSQITQYLNHQINHPNRFVRELLGLFVAEELAHLEIMGAVIQKLDRELIRYVNERGEPWNIDAIDQSTDPLQMLKADIDLEIRSRSLYEKHLGMTKDPGVKKILSFLFRREGIHQSLLLRARKYILDGVPPEQFNGIIYDYKMSLQVLD